MSNNARRNNANSFSSAASSSRRAIGSTGFAQYQRGCMRSGVVARQVCLNSSIRHTSCQQLRHVPQHATNSHGRHRDLGGASAADHGIVLSATVARSCVLLVFGRGGGARLHSAAAQRVEGSRDRASSRRPQRLSTGAIETSPQRVRVDLHSRNQSRLQRHVNATMGNFSLSLCLCPSLSLSLCPSRYLYE